MKTSLLVLFPHLLGAVLCQSGAYQQCGGSGWTGPKSCILGWDCTFINTYYSQCLPGGVAASSSEAGGTAASAPVTEAAATASGWIAPGAVWYDTAGVKIDAHGGGIFKEESTFYWVGSSVSSGVQPRIYSSTDLISWKNMGIAYAVSAMYRPKLFKIGSKYWIWGQVDRYVTPLSSSKVTSGYSKGSSMMLPPNGYSYSDEGIFQDTDGKWYFATSADHNNLQINAVNDDGTIGSRVSKVSGSYEAPGIFKAGSVYFLIVSAKTGYRSNPNKVFWATSISGPWTGPADIAPQAENTYNSQNTHELVIAGSSATTYIYMGDAWTSSGDAGSNYMWLPMKVSTSAHTVTLDYHAYWRVDVKTGVVTTSTTGKRYEAEHASISGRAAVTSCDHCISKRAVHQIDRDSEITFNNIYGTGAAQWVSLHYTVNNRTAGEAQISINDEPLPRNISEYNTRAGQHGTIPVRIHLNEGYTNTIRIGCGGDVGFEIHVDGIEVIDD